MRKRSFEGRTGWLAFLIVALLLGAVGALVAVIARPGEDPFVRTTSVLALVVIGFATVSTYRAFEALRVTARRSREDADGSEFRFKRMFEASPVAMSLSRLPEGTVVAVNDAYLWAFEVARTRLIDRSPAAAGICFVSDSRERLLARVHAGGDLRDHEVVFTTPAGTRKVMLVSSQLLQLEGIPHAQTTFVDVTERRQAQADAQANARQFQELADSVREVFWLTDPTNTRMMYVSRAYERIFGRSCAALYADARDWVAAVHPDDRARIEAIAAGGPTEPLEEMFRVTLPDGRVRRIRVQVTPVHDAGGAVIRIAGIAEDITERFELEEQVRETQKLESLGLLAGGIAHDFNNILAVISANTGLLDELVPKDHLDRELVEEIAAAVTRATSLTRQLLAFSRRQRVEPVVLDLNAAVNDTRKMLRRMVGEDIVMRTSLEPDLPHVRIDPGYLVQVLMNLAVNARDAMPTGGELAIETRHLGAGDHSLVELSISDTGCGMTEEVRARAFEPLFTTKGTGKGTGLGLSVVHGIIEQAGGHIEVESGVGIGTTFRIRLPAIDAQVDPIADVADAGAQGTERVLLVDDDLHVRVCAARALRSRGYEVIEAASAREALRFISQGAAGIDLLVTDVVMPGIDGPELVGAARRRRASLPVLFISGYTDDAVVRHGVEQSQVAFLEKPFRNHALAAKVRQILDAAA